MKVLVINAGSSSLKYQLLNMENESVMTSGIVERIGQKDGVLSHKAFDADGNEKKKTVKQEISDHKVGMHLVIDLLTDKEYGVIASTSEIDVIGHRIVQGGETFSGAVFVDAEVKKAIRGYIPLAPLHNAAHIMGIDVAEDLFPGIPNVVVFDTEFHQTMPPKAYLYALPYEYYEELQVRRYGFHGTSHKYVAKNVAEAMGKKPEDVNVITVHLGNGGSISAVKNGKCIDTSMGMTPLAGVMMGSRCGDIDPAILGYIAEAKNLTPKEIDHVLNKESGLLGVCGMSDMRDIHAAVEKGDERAKLAVEMFTYRVKKYIGAYYAALGSVDAIVFTAGIGENDDIARAGVCDGLENLGIEIDLDKNAGRIGEPKSIHKDGSQVQIWVIPTNEELQIAQDSVALMNTL